MRRFAWILLAGLWGCSNTVTVTVPPKVDLKRYGTLGLVDFASNYDAATGSKATREFLAHIHSAQPGTPLLELGSREALLAGVGGRQLDPDTLRRIGEKHKVDAIFVGDVAYSEKSDYTGDLTRLEGSMRTAVRGDVSAKLLDARSGATVWSSSAWARRETNRINVSVTQGVSGKSRSADPHDEMIPSFIWHLTGDFRATTQEVRKD